MTNGWIDIKNTDMMLIMGGNPAENHPCGFKWPTEARIHRNAKMIVVDPRLTRTAANADLYVQIRAGTDIAFLGGLIHYAIQNNRIAKDYLVHYTNAAFVIKEGFKLPEDGLFSGFDPARQVYDKSTWNYEEGGDVSGKPEAAHQAAAAPAKPGAPPPQPALPANVAYDPTLRLPTAEEAIRTLHTGVCGAGYGHPQGAVPQGRRLVHLGAQRRRHEEGRHHYLCRGLDAAQFRHTDHPHGGHGAVAAGQCGPRGRRGQCAARPLQHPGRHRHGRCLRHPARISEDAESRRCRPGRVPQAHDSHLRQTGSVGFVQLLVQYAQVRRVVPEGDVWAGSH